MRWLPRWPRSLTRRILLVEFVAIGGAALLLPVVLIAVLNHTSARYQDRALLDQARTIARGLRAGPGGGLVATDAIQPTFASAYDGRAFVVMDASGRARLASRYAGALRWKTAPRLSIPVTFRAPPLVGASLPATIADRHLWVLVSQDETRPGAILDDVRRAFPPSYLGVLLPVLLVLPLLNSLLIRRLVQVVRTVSGEAASIDSRTLGTRLATRDLPSEVAPMVHATNALLARLEESFARQGQFVGDVVHELRTPLATLRLAADAVEEGTRARLIAQVDRLTHVVGQLHDLATLEAPDLSLRDRFDLAELARETLAELAGDALANAHPIELLAPDEPVSVTGSRVLIGLALVNLVTNAVRHTPAGTRVTVSVASAAAGGGTLLVEDDGPGVAGWSADDLTRRFWRADHARTDSAGLGLAIVRRICAVHDARLEIGAAMTGGASFAIRLGSGEAPKQPM